MSFVIVAALSKRRVDRAVAIFEAAGFLRVREVEPTNERAKVGDQRGFLFRSGGLQDSFKAAVIANRDQEDATSCRIESCRFEIEEEMVQIVVGQPAEEDPTGPHEILFYRADAVVGVTQRRERLDLAVKPP